MRLIYNTCGTRTDNAHTLRRRDTCVEWRIAEQTVRNIYYSVCNDLPVAESARGDFDGQIQAPTRAREAALFTLLHKDYSR